jgi:hypothetical protein
MVAISTAVISGVEDVMQVVLWKAEVVVAVKPVR